MQRKKAAVPRSMYRQKVSGTAPEKEVFTYTLKEQGASDNQERKLTVEGAGTGTFLFSLYPAGGIQLYF